MQVAVYCRSTHQIGVLDGDGLLELTAAEAEAPDDWEGANVWDGGGLERETMGVIETGTEASGETAALLDGVCGGIETDRGVEIETPAETERVSGCFETVGTIDGRGADDGERIIRPTVGTFNG